ncbi:hypothetical protein Lalb_Chr02g0160511 [Lupinus albus]|uniref:Uncharacterized protein n=1 Tax=Lupinus albus TaxID=3870 RepID=A0A6A4R343_LUPAL|nr:hypothetical protein Lalb_Chr02g0160511 [Lupinus albus]
MLWPMHSFCSLESSSLMVQRTGFGVSFYVIRAFGSLTSLLLLVTPFTTAFTVRASNKCFPKYYLSFRFFSNYFLLQKGYLHFHTYVTIAPAAIKDLLGRY